jgi:hypothetical protein
LQYSNFFWNESFLYVSESAFSLEHSARSFSVSFCLFQKAPTDLDIALTRYAGFSAVLFAASNFMTGYMGRTGDESVLIVTSDIFYDLNTISGQLPGKTDFCVKL